MTGVVDVGDAFELTFEGLPGLTVTMSFLDQDLQAALSEVPVLESPAGSGKYPKTLVATAPGIWSAVFHAPGAPETYYVRARALLGAPPLATVGDVAAQMPGGALTTAQEGMVSHLIRAASALLRQQARQVTAAGIDAAVIAGALDQEVVALAVTNMVLRVVRNPQGLRTETTGPFSRSFWDAGLLVVTAADLAAVTPVEVPVALPDGLAGLGVGTIRVVPGMAPPVNRARWLGGPYGGI